MTHRRAARPVVLAALLLAAGASAAPAPGAPPLPAHTPTAARARVEGVTEHASLAVKADGKPFVTRREVFEFLLDHPDFATHVTRALKLARYRIWRTPGGLGIDDGWGTVGTFETVWSAAGVRLMYARGVYQHKILPDIRGQAVVVIDYGVHPVGEGRSQINAAVTGYVKLDSRVLSMASRLASSVATAKGQKEARKLVELFADTTKAIDKDPAGVFDKVRQRPDVPPRELEDFRRLLNLPSAAR
ncbi:MAG TPA: hypothetical protein VFL90_10640 [Methylomirabilota bacterium]|nr:hypothetical protein [Methylomirabilota bacterium]